MSRSKHTRPDRIRAADRVRDPFEPRSAGDRSRFIRLARELKESGIVLEEREQESEPEQILPRIIVNRPRPGFTHPASKADILAVLNFFGAELFYGLKTIKLMQGAATARDSGTMLFGRLEVPGTILLYEQPESPWFINGIIPESERIKLQRAGATIESISQETQTLVHWTADNLKNFMLFDAFMHEVGHHLIQQYKGKRNMRVARTKDHEHFAALFAQRCRRFFLDPHLPTECANEISTVGAVMDRTGSDALPLPAECANLCEEQEAE